MSSEPTPAPPAPGFESTPDASGAPRRGLWGKLRQGLARTQQRLASQLGEALDRPASLDDERLAALEEALVGADLGLATAHLLLERLEQRLRKSDLARPERLRELLIAEVTAMLAEVPSPVPLGDGPAVLLVVGVNGVGKTTSIAKLARREQAAGHSVMLAAGDTFRAAAIEQLALWGERLGVEVVRQGQGADPAAVVFDALSAARARRVQRLIVDTAGRLHTKDPLMAELAKIRRVIDRAAPDWQRRTLLVLDATTGQNALAQAREFTKTAGVDGLLLAKLDGTAKGGMVLAVGRELQLPVLYLGVGETAEDLVDFEPREFAAALLE